MTRHPCSLGPISFIFTQFWEKNCPDNRLAPPVWEPLVNVVSYHQVIHVNNTIRTWICSSGSRISQMGLGAPTPEKLTKTYYFARFLPKTCMKTTPTLGSANGMVIKPMRDFHSSHKWIFLYRT